MKKIKHFIVYKTVNLITDEFYFGVHGQYEDDEYMGSGIRLMRQIKKYGKASFVRETLSIWETEREAFDEEKRVLKNWLGHPQCLNISPGGDGGANFLGKSHTDKTRQVLKEKATGRTLDAEARKKISAANKSRTAKQNANFYNSAKNRSPEKQLEVNAKISRSLQGRKSRPHSQVTKERLSRAAKKRYQDLAERKKTSDAMKAIWSTEKRATWGQTQKDKWTPELREKLSKSLRSKDPHNKKLLCGHIAIDKCGCD